MLILGHKISHLPYFGRENNLTEIMKHFLVLVATYSFKKYIGLKVLILSPKVFTI